MENWGLVTYREVDLMIDTATASSARKQRVATIIGHELAHQWFGNLVTMDWWDDLWLNEGFASFMMYSSTNVLFPEWNIWEQYTTDTMSAAFRLDSLRSSHPIQVPIMRAEEVEQVFDAISYNKGASVVRMVEGVLGEEKFRDGLRLYMKTHAYGNTVTSDLWSAWSTVSGVDVAGLMASWTRQMGYPFLSVVKEVWSASEVVVTLEQSWFLADGSTSEEDKDKLWSIPIIFSTSQSTSDAVIMSRKVDTFTIALSGGEGEYVKINAGQLALVRVAHSAEMLKRLRAAIQNKSVNSVDRAALILDAYALAKAGYAPLEDAVLLLRAFEKEDNASVWNALSGILSGLNLLMEAAALTTVQPSGNGETRDALAAFKAFSARLVKNALSIVGWEAVEGESHSSKLLRGSLTTCTTFPLNHW